MNRMLTFFFRSSFFVCLLGILIAPEILAQQEQQSDKTFDAIQKQRLRALSIDSSQTTIFPPRKVMTEEEIEAQRLFTEGSKKGKAGDYKGSIEDLTQSLALFENSNTYLKRGFAYLFSSQYPQALQDFTDALRLIPGNREALFGMGVARFEMKDYEAAEKDLAQYTDMIFINAMAFDYLAAICFMRQDFQCALEQYTNVIRNDSSYLNAFANRGMIRHYLRDYKGALEDYDVAIGQDSTDKKIYNNRAAAKMLLKDYNAALKDFNHAISLDPLYADAYNNRGRVRFYLGDTQGACSDWKKALDLGIEASRDLIIKNCK